MNDYQEKLEELLRTPVLISNWRVRYLAGCRHLPRSILFKFIDKYEGGPWFSHSLRELLGKRYGVLAGAYSYGSLLIPGSASPGLVVGRYVSIASGVVWGSDHPKEMLSTHPVFYLPSFGLVDESPLPDKKLEICADAWIGTNVVITSKCKRIGYGAVVGAGAVVTKDVPDFAIVVGVPAALIRYRFDVDVQKRVLESKWWELDAAEVLESYGGLVNSSVIKRPDLAQN
ncbi:hypothetical protein [Laribacter hongkongensis]|uniref:hypothetical protein n=1 Tax=Laribacter hongkongensis TaxID=168471 RepID=UPI0023D9646A|nr:hypothetical protein [Laribacter hongkongensis]